MRRFINGLLILTVIASLSAPTHAAARRDAGGGFYRDSIQKIVQLIRKVVRKLDDPKPIWPIP